MTAKVLNAGFYWPSIHKDAHEFSCLYVHCQSIGNMNPKDMMTLNPILEVEIFDAWDIDFMGSFVTSFGYQFIFVTINYV
jgi:hypothetical protein